MSTPAGQRPLDEQSVAGLLELMSGRRPGPSAGSAAALVTATAAALLGKTARLSTEQLADAETLAEGADTLRDRALELAAEDAAGVRAMLTGGTQEPGGCGDLDPSAVPRRIEELAADIEQLAAQLAEQGNPSLRADAHSAWHLARAARASIEAIVRSNRGRH